MKGEGQELDLSQLAQIHEHKTGKLLTFPFVAAGIVAQKKSRGFGKSERSWSPDWSLPFKSVMIFWM